jgi:hypothetical protein
MSLHDILQAVQVSGSKIRRIYNEDAQLITEYEAPANQRVGGPCIKRIFSYGEHGKVVYMSEIQDTWTADMELK